MLRYKKNLRQVFCIVHTTTYVEELRKLVFSMSNVELKAVSERHSARVPQPLNTQFPDRRKKEEAVKLHADRKKRLATELYPTGKMAFNVQ